MKTLLCLHNFCRCCIAKVFRDQLRQLTTNDAANYLLYCPECSHKMIIPDPPDGVLGNRAKEEEHVQWVLGRLEPNPFILNLLKAKELQQNAQLCERCFKDHTTIPASAWCRNCDRSFCKRCLKLHKDFSMHSEIVSLSDGDLPTIKELMPTRKCDTHKELVNTYCTRCRLCLCQSCWISHFTETGNCPPPLPMDKLAGLKKADGNVLLSGIKTSENDIKRRNEDILSRMSKVKKDYQVASDKIRSDLDRLIQIFTRKADELLSGLETAARDETEGLTDQLSQNGLWLNQMDFLALNVKTLLANATSTDLVSCFPKLDYCWESLQSSIDANMVNWKRLSVNYSGQYAKLLRNAEQMTVGQVEVGEATATNESMKTDKAAILVPDARILSDINTGVQCQLTASRNMETQTKIVSTSDASAQSGESIPRLIDAGRWSISGSSIDFVDGVVVGVDGHVFLCCRSLKQVREYTSEGLFLFACSLPCRPFDIAGLMEEIIAVVSSDDHMIVLLLRTPSDKDLLKVSKVVHTKKNYVSVCGFGNLFYACRRSGEIELINAEANVMISVSQPSAKADPRHRIVLGSTTHSVVFLDYVDQTLTLYGRSGKSYLIANARNRGGHQSTSHMFMDAHGVLFACNSAGIYTVGTEDSPSCVLWTFEDKKLKSAPRFCIGGNKLFLSYFANNRKEIRVFKVSYLS